jgi:excisionase family DNA binding protein
MVERSPYLTLNEGAALLRCHPQTLRAMLERGDIPYRRIGVGKKAADIRISRAALEHYMADTAPPQRGAAG